MDINVQVLDRSARITLPSRFEFGVHRDFRNAYIPLLDNAALHEVEIEMGKVDYLDFAALGMLILLNERGKDACKSILLVNVSAYAAQVLDAANFNRIFNIKNAP
jgi:anti-anti-sigma factor